MRGFHAWLTAGRVVRKGQKCVKIVAPVMGGENGAKVVNIRPAWVFDVSQTDERTPHAPPPSSSSRPGIIPGRPATRPTTRYDAPRQGTSP